MVKLWVKLLVISWSLYMLVALLAYPFTDSPTSAVKNAKISELLLIIARTDLDDDKRLKMKREKINHDMEHYGGNPSATLSDGMRSNRNITDVKYEEISLSEAMNERGGHMIKSVENQENGLSAAKLKFHYDKSDIEISFLIKKTKYGPLISKNEILTPLESNVFLQNGKKITLNENNFIKSLFELSTKATNLPKLDEINAKLTAPPPAPDNSTKAVPLPQADMKAASLTPPPTEADPQPPRQDAPIAVAPQLPPQQEEPLVESSPAMPEAPHNQTALSPPTTRASSAQLPHCTPEIITAHVMCIGGASPSSTGPSFNCQKANTVPEKTICSDQKLSELDRNLGETYNLAYRTRPNKIALRASQLEWIRSSRDVCLDNVECMKKAYEDRIETLR